MSTSPRRIAIFGASSDIAVAFARAQAPGGTRFALAGRDSAALERLAQDLKVRGAGEVAVHIVDLADLAALPAAADAMWSGFGGLDVALIAYGSLPDQAKACLDPALAEEALRLNFTSPALLVNTLASYFEAARAGTIAVITSVAGDRGRQSNYVYGGAKGGLQTFLDGVRHRLHGSGVNVLDIRPGFVATKMTQHLPQKGPLWAQPDKVAADISTAIAKRRAVLYTPWFWRVIMGIVCALPRALFHRSKL